MKQLSSEAVRVLGTDLEVDGRHVRITKALDRKLYVEVNSALAAIGGKWVRGAKAHVFEGDPADDIDQILVDGGFHDRRRDLDQFFTPALLAAQIVERAHLRGRTVLEPSAGAGALVFAARAAGAAMVLAIEKDPKVACVGAEIGDFLTLTVGPGGIQGYERVVMNPPFSRQRDIDHVVHAHKCLASQGLLIAVMSAGVSFREDCKARDFRRFVGRKRGTISPLPEHAFRESGTDVNAVLVTVPA